jgi:hypothetical protein
MAPILIGSLVAAGFAKALAGAGLDWAITIETSIRLTVKIRTVKNATRFILFLLSSFIVLFCL